MKSQQILWVIFAGLLLVLVLCGGAAYLVVAVVRGVTSPNLISIDADCVYLRGSDANTIRSVTIHPEECGPGSNVLTWSIWFHDQQHATVQEIVDDSRDGLFDDPRLQRFNSDVVESEDGTVHSVPGCALCSQHGRLIAIGISCELVDDPPAISIQDDDLIHLPLSLDDLEPAGLQIKKVETAHTW